MKANKPYPDITENLEARWNILMSIQNFKDDLKYTTKRIRMRTDSLIQVYETALDFLDENNQLDLSKQKVESDYLNGVRVHANQMIHALDLINKSKGKNKPALSDQITVFEDKLERMIESALDFEGMGNKILQDHLLQKWNKDFCVFDIKYADDFENFSITLKLINQFYENYSPDEIKVITKIIAKNKDNILESTEAEKYEIQHLKAISQFKREFHPQNLWDKFLEILAGGVHPSPGERVMLNNWIEGKPKVDADEID